MEFRILGPLEVCVEGGRKLDLTGKQRALLAILLLHANEPISTDRLIDELWDGEPPDTASKALQVYVSRLRKLLGPERLQTKAPGYLLRVEPEELDVGRFEQLQKEGRLTEALSLWRGSPLSDVADERFAQGEIARLEELRLACLEQRIERDLGEGRHADVIGELEALVAEHPLRERLRAQLMLALYRSRRQAEALNAYQAARRSLVDELGIEPSLELQELERRILRQDRSLDVETPLPEDKTSAEPVTPRRRAAGTFVAREWELATLEAGLEDALAGRGRLFLLVGEAGIGKSRLADEFAARAKERGVLVLWGRCWEAGGAPAYWPWVQSLRSYVRSRSPEVLRTELGPGAADLAQLLPELHELEPDLATPPALDPDSARFRLFDSVAAFLRSAASGQTLVLVLDDLHAADEPSLLLLRFLAGELAEISLVVVGTYREEDAAEDEPVSASLSELRRLPSRHLRLGGLSGSEVASFIELSTGVTPPESLVDAVHTETEGNPLFVGEIVRLLASEGRLSESPDVGWRLEIPPGLREVIARRLRRLSKECRRLLTLASVLGREFSLEALEQVSELPEEELLEVLDEAFAARVLTEVPGAVGRMRFSHARVRDALYDDLSIARRAQLHRRIGEALEELYAPDPEPYLAELAHHFFLAGPRGDVEKTIQYTRRAGDRALALLAYEEAVRQYRMALRALERRDAKDDAEKCELLLALGDALAMGGSTPEAKETFLATADLARASGLLEHLARAALGYGGRFPWMRAGTDSRLVPLLEEALAALGEEESLLRVRLLSRLAGALRDQPSLEPRSSLSRQALEIARRLGDPEALSYAFISLATWGPEIEELGAVAEETSRLAEETGNPERALQALWEHHIRWMTLGETDRIASVIEESKALADELKQPSGHWYSTVMRSDWALFQGEFSEAERLAEEAFQLGQRAQSWDAGFSHRIFLFALRREQGRLDEVADLIRQSVDEYAGYRLFRCLLPLLEWELGREAETRRAFDELAADDFGALPRDGEWIFCLSVLAEAAGHLGDRERAAVLYGLLLPYGHLNALASGEVAIGSVARYLGILALANLRWADAAQHFDDALQMNARMGGRPWVAHTQYDYARMLLARGQAGDAERAHELLESCLSTCGELGMSALEDQASTLMGDTARGAIATGGDG